MTLPPGGFPVHAAPTGPARQQRRAYAADTTVAVDRSRIELERLLRRYGADQFVSAWDPGAAVIGFRMYGRFVRFRLPLPTDSEVAKTPTGRKRDDRQRAEARAQEERRRWRALLLVLKAKLEAVKTGIVSFEQEFLGSVLLPDGRTVGDAIAPAVADAYATGKQPSLLLGPAGEERRDGR